MDPLAWLEKASKELAALLPMADRDACDAWRAAVLAARLIGNPLGVGFADDLRDRVRLLVDVAGPPDAEELLGRVADELDADDDPFGPLHDALLDADDAVGVLGVLGDEEGAIELAGRVAGMISLFPDRVLDLDEFAEMRLGSLAATKPEARIWRAVEHAAAILFASALPSPDASGGVSPRTGRALVLELRIPTERLRAVAQSPSGEVTELRDGTGAVRGWLSEEDGHMVLEIKGLASGRAALVAWVLADGVEFGRSELRLRVSGRNAYADLGPAAGAGNILHELVARAGLSPEAIGVRLVVADD